MKLIKKKLDKDLKSIEIVPIADLHIGDENCDMDMVKSLIDYVKKHKNAYCVLNGDIIDNAIMSSVGDTYKAKKSPMKQIIEAVELFKPIKDKILCITGGNHEYRTYKSVGVDLMEIVARELGIDDIYSMESATILLRLGHLGDSDRQIPYTLFVSHGAGAGSSVGGKVNSLARFENVIDADVYFGGHTHQASIFPTSSYRVDVRNNTLQLVNKLFVSNGSTLKYGGYAEMKTLKPTTLVFPVVTLDGTRKNISAEMSVQ
jgi:predicted MPP superfamily phosphohydrolase